MAKNCNLKTLKQMKTMNYIFILLIALMGCTKMEDNYKQYLEETIYPGKVSNVKAQIGIERIYLDWIPPTDPKSSRIMVKYTEVDSVVTDSIVSNIIISGLKESRGYEFAVSSLDEYGNKSVSEVVTAKPIMQSYVDNNVVPSKPTFTYRTISKVPTGTIKWEKLTTSVMKYLYGNYKLSLASGEVFSGDLIETKKGVIELPFPGVNLSAQTFLLEYTMVFVPLQTNGKPIVDVVSRSVSTDKIIIVK
jgi:hypothetical protein